MKARTIALGGIILAVVIFVSLNMLANESVRGSRVDLTQSSLYTLSDGTRKVLASIDEPITLRLYLSKRIATTIPSVSGHASRVLELLDEYTNASNGKLVVSVIDPEPFSEEEDRAVGLGLTGVPLQDGETTFYFGLVGTNSLDAQEIIPYLSTERSEFVEYDLTKMIQTLTSPKRKVLGLLSGLALDGMTPQRSMAGQPPRPWVIYEQIDQQYEIKRIRTTAKAIGDDIDLLMIVHPKSLSDHLLYAIDQYVIGGGHALVFVDPNAEVDAAPSSPGLPPLPGTSDLGKLLESWGLSMDVANVAGDLQLALKVRTQQRERVVTVKYPAWLNVPNELINTADIVTSQLGNMTFASPGSLVTLDDASSTITPLVSTTDGATTIDKLKIGPMADLEEVLRNYEPGGKPLTLVARVSGQTQSAFPEGRPKAGPATEKTQSASAAKADDDASKAAVTKPHQSESGEGGINIIVVADSDLLQDQFWVQSQDFLGQRLNVPIAGNGAFVINALDNLSGSSELISVRSRTGFRRPFTVINERREEAEVKFREKERELIEQLRQTEERIESLQQVKGQKDALVLSDAQREEIARFRTEKVRIRRDLRDVRASLRKDIERLEGTVKFINAGLVPLLVIVIGLIVATARVRRRRAHQQPAGA